MSTNSKYQKILFSSLQSTQYAKYQVHTINADGSDQTQLTTTEGSHAFFSPDGSQLVYVAEDKLYIMDADGSNQYELNSITPVILPAWSPDGKRIAFTSSKNGPRQLYVLEIGESEPQQITFNTSHDYVDPKWSPDGKNLVFTGDSDLYTMRIGENPELLYAGAANPDWSPDGSKIAYSRNNSVYTMNADGTNHTNLAIGRYPNWSPDGKRIAYGRAFESIRHQIMVMDADGSNQERLTFDSSLNIPSCWSSGIVESSHQGTSDDQCIVYSPSAGEQTNDPVSLKDGEKREKVTDLNLNTPAGALTFTRAYAQGNQRDAAFQFMGLGWTHNHNLRLEAITGSPKTIIVHTDQGGQAHFTESSTADHYEANPGSNAIVDWDNVASEYTLTKTDTSELVFDSNGKLTSRNWPSGESWSYHYYLTGADINN